MTRQHTRKAVQLTAMITRDGNMYVGNVRNISANGCYIESCELFAVGDIINLAFWDAREPTPVQIVGTIMFVEPTSSGGFGLGIQIRSQTERWLQLVSDCMNPPQPYPPCRQQRAVLFVGSPQQWREQPSLNNWQMYYAHDVNALLRLLSNTTLDAVICDWEFPICDWQSVLQITKFKQPSVRRFFRCRIQERKLPCSGPSELVQKLVNYRFGFRPLLNVLAAELGTRSTTKSDIED